MGIVWNCSGDWTRCGIGDVVVLRKVAGTSWLGHLHEIIASAGTVSKRGLGLGS
jgi:hypothetical protein